MSADSSSTKKKKTSSRRSPSAAKQQVSKKAADKNLEEKPISRKEKPETSEKSSKRDRDETPTKKSSTRTSSKKGKEKSEGTPSSPEISKASITASGEYEDVPVETITSPIEWDGKDEHSNLIGTQSEIMFLLLESREIMNKMVRWRWNKEKNELEEKRRRERERRKLRGRLSPTEIQALLKMQPDEEDFDWITEIEELKKQLVQEIRRNHTLDQDLHKLDQRIGLLIANRNALDVLQTTEKRRRRTRRNAKKKNPNEPKEVFDLSKNPQKLAHYQELFYLLQTEPRYLAKCLYLVQSDQMDSFLDTTILTLYGDAFSPREEYLILNLFKEAISNEIGKIKSLSDFLKGTTVVPKMVITYNRRKQGLEFLKKTLGPVLKKVMEKKDLSLELHPMTIYFQIINEQEIKSGAKSKLDRNISEQEAMKNPDVKAVIKKRLDALREICQMFLDAVVNSMNSLPYGIRYICKQIKEISHDRFGQNLDHDQVLKVTGYFVYYRFMNLAIVTPDAYNVIDKELDGGVRRNLVVVGKVLQNLFNFRTFNQQQELYMTPLNSFIEKNKPIVEHYFNSLVKVDEPEDHLQVNKYVEFTQKTKPVILISLHEIAETHNLLLENLDELTGGKETDELKIILNDLGDAPPEIEEEEDREIQLTLNNRFKKEIVEDDEVEALYLKTKELIIPVLRTIPIENSIQRLHLTDVLESGIKFANETKNKGLSGQINKILENISKLEKEGRLTKADRYESFVHDISMEVANRNVVREQQKREVERLKTTLKGLREHQTYVTDQMKQYQEYLNIAKEKHYRPNKKKTKKTKKGEKAEGKTIVGPFKFSYKDLSKKGVIKDSDVPAISRKKTQFLISSEEAGVFDVVAKIAGINVEKMKLELDDLLEKQHTGVEFMELDQITLDVNMTIHLINHFFLGKK